MYDYCHKCNIVHVCRKGLHTALETCRCNVLMYHSSHDAHLSTGILHSMFAQCGSMYKSSHVCHDGSSVPIES